ncbi:MAG: hypothetical protein ACE5Z5_11090 [Candidatus Bathyarchaeia archaeon]
MKRKRPPDRKCIDCGADISHRGPRSTRCVSCQAMADQEYHREYYRLWRRRRGKGRRRRVRVVGETRLDRGGESPLRITTQTPMGWGPGRKRRTWPIAWSVTGVAGSGGGVRGAGAGSWSMWPERCTWRG